MPMPEAWEFEIDFDAKTGHVSKVAAGDNRRYEQYIAARIWPRTARAKPCGS